MAVVPTQPQTDVWAASQGRLSSAERAGQQSVTEESNSKETITIWRVGKYEASGSFSSLQWLKFDFLAHILFPQTNMHII